MASHWKKITIHCLWLHNFWINQSSNKLFFSIFFLWDVSISLFWYKNGYWIKWMLLLIRLQEPAMLMSFKRNNQRTFCANLILLLIPNGFPISFSSKFKNDTDNDNQYKVSVAQTYMQNNRYLKPPCRYNSKPTIIKIISRLEATIPEMIPKEDGSSPLCCFSWPGKDLVRTFTRDTRKIYINSQCITLWNKLIPINRGHCRDLESVSSLSKVHNSGNIFQSIICKLFSPGIYIVDVPIIGLSVIVGCAQGENCLWKHSHNLPWLLLIAI